MKTIFHSAKVIKDDHIMDDITVIISESGKIEFIGNDKTAPKTNGRKINVRGKYLSPGFIDQHVHGGFGYSFSDDEVTHRALSDYSEKTTKYGITGFLAGLVPNDRDLFKHRIAEYADCFSKGLSGAEGLGLFLEGPFMETKASGCTKKEWIYTPTIKEAEEYIEYSRKWIRLVTVAPEIPNSFTIASLFRQNGITVSLGITYCDYELGKKALETNHTNIDHIFNNFKAFHHRAPGAVGAALSTDKPITCEINTDMVHVHPAAVQIVFRCIGTDRTIIVSDGNNATGLSDGKYTFIGEDVIVKNYLTRTSDGTIAGGSSPLNRNIRLAIKECRISFVEAIKMVTENPAKALGLSDRVGSISVGKDANLVVIDEKIDVYLTMVKGRIVHSLL